MDAGMRMAQRRNLTLAVFDQTKAAKKKNQPYDNPQNLYFLYTTMGKYPLYKNNILDTTLTHANDPPPCYLAPILLSGLESILSLSATALGGKLGPNKIAFLLYAYWFGVTTGYNWIANGPIKGVKDNWNWDIHYIDTDMGNEFLFMNSVLQYILPLIFTNAFNLNATFDPTQLVNYGYSMTYLSPIDYAAKTAKVNATAHFSEWQTAFNTWFLARNNEAKTVAAGITSKPNGTHTVCVADGTTDPISGFPNPTLWTPLKLPPPSNAVQSYYTPMWHTLTSPSAFTPTQTNDISGAGDAFYTPDGPVRDTDIDAMFSLVANLNDSQKSIAEFWAAITNTVAPPGMLFWFWKQYIQAYDIGNTVGDTAVIYSGFHLALGLLEAGRMCWGLKYKHFQARPIQEIRRRKSGQTVTNWNGSVLGDNWLPYQPYGFITPAFPDFPSGHSAFSQTFANVMTAWFGPNIINPPTQTLTDLQLLSPSFTGVTQIQPFGTIVFPQGKSQVNGTVPGTTAGTVPATAQTLTWTSWQEMADQAGISRQYGGIHPAAAHNGSKAFANAMFPVMNRIWGL
jgi:hypothetical protein